MNLALSSVNFCLHIYIKNLILMYNYLIIQILFPTQRLILQVYATSVFHRCFVYMNPSEMLLSDVNVIHEKHFA